MLSERACLAVCGFVQGTTEAFDELLQEIPCIASVRQLRVAHDRSLRLGKQSRRDYADFEIADTQM